MLDRHRGAKVRVYVVWEPIILTDWGAPGSGARARVGDSRAEHYWDRDHLVAVRMDRDARAPQPTPECCRRKQVLWDLAAFYPPGAVWGDALPAATLFNGPVVDREGEIDRALAALKP